MNPPMVSPEPAPSPHPQLTANHVEVQLRVFILHELAATEAGSIDRDTPLFETLLDSTSVLALVSYLERQYGLDVRDSEVVPAHFSTLRRLAAFVLNKLHPTQLAANG